MNKVCKNGTLFQPYKSYITNTKANKENFSDS